MFESLGVFALLALLVCPLMMVGMAAFAWIAGRRSGGEGGHAGHGMMCHTMGHGGHRDHWQSEEAPPEGSPRPDQSMKH
jgi:hypothetical protein